MLMITLDLLPLNTQGKIAKLHCNGDIRRRMLDLGIIPGTIIKPVLKSPSGDPRAFEIRSTLLAIRSEDARNIELE